MITKIIVLTVLGLIAVEGFAQDAPKSVPLSNETKLEVELIQKDSQDIKDTLDKLQKMLTAPINARSQTLMEKVCSEAKFPIATCSLNIQKGVLENNLPPAQPSPAPAKEVKK